MIIFINNIRIPLILSISLQMNSILQKSSIQNIQINLSQKHNINAYNKTIDSFLNQLGIGNVEAIYKNQETKVNSMDKDYMKRELMKTSVDRLYRNTKKSTADAQNSGIEHEINDNSESQHIQQQKAEKVYYQNIASKQQNYQLTFLSKALQKRISLTHQSLNQCFNKSFPTNASQFNLSMILFLTKRNTFKNQKQFLLRYKQYLALAKEEDFQGFTERVLEEEEVANIVGKAGVVVWLYCYFSISLLTEDKLQKINTVKDWLNWVQDHINADKNWQAIADLFKDQLNIKFTTPYQTSLYALKQLKPHTIYEQPKQNNKQAKITKFTANPIPQTTYHPPKKHKLQQKKKTSINPFNLSKSIEKKQSSNDRYNWNRTFKAKQVPKCIYQSTNEINQRQKQVSRKQRCQKLLKTSSYPSTMKYLQNNEKISQQRYEQLYKKYQKKRQTQKVKQVPNYKQLHLNQMKTLQTRKQSNKKTTQPKPFSFSIIEKAIKPQKTQILHQQKVITKLYQTSSEFCGATPKSTLKHDTYLQKVKQDKQQSKAHKMRLQVYEKEKKRNMQTYKNILMTRMKQQLLTTKKGNHPAFCQAGINNINQLQQHSKLDMQKIYKERPLLMQNEKTLSKTNSLSQTCFTDLYHSII